MSSEQRLFVWVGITFAAVGFFYFIFRSVTNPSVLTRRLPNAGTALGSVAVLVQVLIRPKHQRAANILLATGGLLIIVSVIASIANEIMNG
ncbi:MAG: hypothetical protein M3R24_09105 [Chloroflexota bacterium]|nr:hypothetical protein [Chloroflexota bacterium]